MDPENLSDDVLVRVLALTAAAVVNAGTGNHQHHVTNTARHFEIYLRGDQS